jgi:hypothetical protein
VWRALGQQLEPHFLALQAFAPSASAKSLLRAVHALSQPSPRAEDAWKPKEDAGPSRPELWQTKPTMLAAPPVTLRLDELMVLVRIVATDKAGVDQGLLWSGLLPFVRGRSGFFTLGVYRDQGPLLFTLPVPPEFTPSGTNSYALARATAILFRSTDGAAVQVGSGQLVVEGYDRIPDPPRHFELGCSEEGHRLLQLPPVPSRRPAGFAPVVVNAEPSVFDMMCAGMLSTAGVGVNSIGVSFCDALATYPGENEEATLMACEHCLVWNTHL